MDDKTRDEMRDLQDRLLHLAFVHHIDLDLQITHEWAGAPTFRQLQVYLRPEFRAAIEYAIHYIETNY